MYKYFSMNVKKAPVHIKKKKNLNTDVLNINFTLFGAPIKGVSRSRQCRTVKGNLLSSNNEVFKSESQRRRKCKCWYNPPKGHLARQQFIASAIHWSR